MNFFAKLWRYCRSRWWAAPLTAMVALVAADTVYHAQLTWNLSWGKSVVLPAPDASSPSGYANNEHTLILPYQGIDGYHWIIQTQQMLAGGGARIRAVDYDNAPNGREVHWASALRWWMAGLAWVDHAYTGTPLPWAVEEIAPFASTLLVVLLIVLFTPVLAARLGAIPASLFAFGTVGVGPVYESFTEGRLDHHGLASLNALVTLLLLVGGGGGWVRGDVSSKDDTSPLFRWLPDRRQAKRWFIAAGIAGGIGLWISTASEAPVLAEVGLGALLATGLLGRGTRQEDGARPDPSLWRVWAWSGAATSLFFYLVEYFPSHLGMRLEVNHPLYALAWAGGGEIIFRVSRWWSGGRLVESPRDGVWLGFGAMALAAILGVLLVATEKVFWINDRFLWVMHNDYIVEFTDMGRFLKSQWDNGQTWMFLIFANPLVLLLAPMLFWSCRPRFPRPLRALLLLILPPGVITFALSVAQVRWTEINYSLWLAALVAVALVLQLNGHHRWTWPRRIAAAVLLAWGLLANPAFLAKTWIATGWKPEASQVEVLQQIARDAAQRLRARSGPGDVTVLSGATSSTWLTFYGGFKTVGTYYWENLAGLKTAAKIYGATYDEAAQLLPAHHIDYLVVFSFVDVPEEYTRLARGLRATAPVPQDAFLIQLQRDHQIRPWLRPIFYPLPEQFRQKIAVFIYQWAPQQTVPEAYTRLAQWQFDSGHPDGALNLVRSALSLAPSNLPALITLARIQIAANATAEFNGTFQLLRAQTPLATALNLGDRVDLAAVFSHTPEQGLAREQLHLAIQSATSESLHALRQDSLYNLLLLSRAFSLLAERPALWSVGLNLLPPTIRLQLLLQCADAEKAIGHPHEALVLLQKARLIDPDSLLLLNRLALLLCASPDATVRDGSAAVAIAEHMYQLDQGAHVNITDTLACAYAEAGDFTRARDVEKQAIAVAAVANAPQLVEVLQAHLALFQNQLPYRE